MDRRRTTNPLTGRGVLSDRRYKNYGEVTPSEDVDEAEHQHAVEDAIERLDSMDSLQWYEHAAASEGTGRHDQLYGP